MKEGDELLRNEHRRLTVRSAGDGQAVSA